MSVGLMTLASPIPSNKTFPLSSLKPWLHAAPVHDWHGKRKGPNLWIDHWNCLSPSIRLNWCTNGCWLMSICQKRRSQLHIRKKLCPVIGRVLCCRWQHVIDTNVKNDMAIHVRVRSWMHIPIHHIHHNTNWVSSVLLLIHGTMSKWMSFDSTSDEKSSAMYLFDQSRNQKGEPLSIAKPVDQHSHHSRNVPSSPCSFQVPICSLPSFQLHPMILLRGLLKLCHWL